MRLRAVYAFQPPNGYSDYYDVSRGQSPSPTKYVPIQDRLTEQAIRDMACSNVGLVWGHVIEVQDKEAIFVTTLGQLERVPFRHLVLLDFLEAPV